MDIKQVWKKAPANKRLRGKYSLLVKRKGEGVMYNST